MQGDFEANSPIVIHALCPCGHIIFPKGISIKTLYKNHNGVRVNKTQKVDWDASEHYTLCPSNKNHYFNVFVDKQTKKEFSVHLFYKLTDEQVKLLKVKCPTCFPFVKK